MAISEIPLFTMLRTRMHWHQERQRVLAENVANADTPRFQPRDLAPPSFDRGRMAGQELSLARTSPAHLAGASGGTRFQLDRNGGFEARPSGNAVSLEDEMMKVATNQMDYQAATSLYARGLGMLKTAIGRR
ncbi:MAG: flagellar basal body rod protein FlgB [Rhizobiales bacterium]|nr:flagellar basal body rod protein FlgB [Hyphomicrobiales bacterium]